MKKTKLLIAIMCMCSFTVLVKGQNYFEEVDGNVSMEAEHFQVSTADAEGNSWYADTLSGASNDTLVLTADTITSETGKFNFENKLYYFILFIV